ncbi:MAG: hypothetical protein JST92_17115, partial [Deltaproteobacteria bacterium]|nr:hypothetical protein [Deltaproteobacteria bacterium]
MPERLPNRGPSPAAPELLRAALEKIVFFEWRLSELAAELAGAQSRSSSAEAERVKAEEARRAAELQSSAARLQLAELEADRARMAALLARPQQQPGIDSAALESERQRAAQLQAELDECRRELELKKLERSRWMDEMIAQARAGDEEPAALAQFISELRGEVLALRERQRQTDALFVQHGLTPPAPAEIEPVAPVAHREPDAVEAARKLWAEGRLGGLSAELDRAAAAQAISRGKVEQAVPQASHTEVLPGIAALNNKPAAVSQPAQPARPTGGAAALALAEQCLKGLVAHDPARRAQAARHLAALPSAAAAPALAAALGRETDTKARADLARALVACGGEAAFGMVAALQTEAEAPLVRMAALESLAALGGAHAREAIDLAASDAVPAVRRRAAALAQTVDGCDEILARLAADPDTRVRAAALNEDTKLPAPSVIEHVAPAPVQAPAPIASQHARVPSHHAPAASVPARAHDSE